MFNTTVFNGFIARSMAFCLLCLSFSGYSQNNSDKLTTVEIAENPVLSQVLGCTDLDYCFSTGNTAFEWLDSVQINDYLNVSGSNEGYALFEDISEEFELEQEISCSLTPGYSGYPYDENFLIFIDINQNGEFGMDEVVFNQQGNSTISGTFIIPPDAKLGSTRMRILMNYNGAEPIACPQGGYDGETEDYCIVIKNSFSECLSIQNLGLGSFSTTELDLKWDAPENAIGYEVNYKEVGSADWLNDVSQFPELVLKDLEICTEYEVKINSICINGQSGFPAESHFFKTTCNVRNLERLALDQAITIYPNPTSGITNLKYESDAYAEIQVEIQNAQGQIIGEKLNFEITPGENNLQLNNISEYNSGLFLVKIRQNELSVIKKLVKL